MLTTGEGGKASYDLISYDSEKAWSSINHSTLYIPNETIAKMLGPVPDVLKNLEGR